jgi:hypothetical protein
MINTSDPDEYDIHDTSDLGGYGDSDEDVDEELILKNEV